MIKIDGIISFRSKVISVEYNKVYVLLEDGCKGLLYYYDLPNYKTDMSYIFNIGQIVYVRKKQMLFNDLVLVTMKNLIAQENIEDLSGNELYGIVCKELKHGTLIQITPNLQVCIYGTYIPIKTKVLVSIQKNRNGRVKAYLSSVIYDDYITVPIFSFKYKNIEI